MLNPILEIRKLFEGGVEMKRITLVIALFSFWLLLSPAFAAEQQNLFYVGILGGYVMPRDMAIHDKTGGNPDFDATLKNGGLFGIKAGFLPAFANKYLATELEYNYFFNTEFDKDKSYKPSDPYRLEGDNKIHAVFLNFILRYPETSFHPYIGIGPGYSWFQAGDLKVTDSAGTTTLLAGETTGQFCWQLLAGLDYDITRNWGVGIGYKYFQVKPSPGGAINSDYDYSAHIITLGVQYTF